MQVVKTEELVEYIKKYSLIGNSGYSQSEQEDGLIEWIGDHCFKINEDKNCTQSEDEFYKPMCPYGYADCIYDCNYIKTLYPDWYIELGSPTECDDCKDGSMYDDEDK